MGRLTKRGTYNGDIGIWVKEIGGNETFFATYDEGFKAIEKLAHYEDMEEQGRLIKVEYATIVGEFGICSKCGESYMDVADADADQSRYIPNFCPWCGARFVSEAKLEEQKGE